VVLNETHTRKFAASHGLERFTKAHEIGHWMLHVDKERGEYSADLAPEFIVRGALHSGITRGRETNWLERHADWFAAALLMPANVFVPIAEDYDLRDPRALKKLATTFGVSLSALRTRLSQLGFVYAP
jgi:Zn-dependent peptidase ImmA (M78 family)